MSCVTCPVCLGERGFDFAHLDAIMEEHLTDEQLARAKALAAARGQQWGGVVECPECEGTAIVTQARHDELMAEARKSIKAVLDRIERSGT